MDNPIYQTPAQLRRPPFLIRRQGYPITIAANTASAPTTLNPLGGMNGLVGLIITRPDGGNLNGLSFNFQVNSDIVVQNMPATLASPSGMTNNIGYLNIDRPISGQDNIQIAFTNTNGNGITVNVLLIYSQTAAA
ncbi:hypothetical protein EBR96_07195 [bacterium]|nr:hypothetical protein [bacterium]